MTEPTEPTEQERDEWREMVATLCGDGGQYHQAHGTVATREYIERRWRAMVAYRGESHPVSSRYTAVEAVLADMIRRCVGALDAVLLDHGGRLKTVDWLAVRDTCEAARDLAQAVPATCGICHRHVATDVDDPEDDRLCWRDEKCSAPVAEGEAG